MRSRFEKAPTVPDSQANRVVLVVSVGAMVGVVDQLGSFIEIPARYHRAGRMAQLGESWVIDRSLGFWTLLFPLDGVVTPTSKLVTTVIGSDTIPHLFGRDVTVQVFDDTTGAMLLPIVEVTEVDGVVTETTVDPNPMVERYENRVELVFETAPPNPVRVVIVG